MKQLLLTISALLFATAVCAEGYQVNTLSAKQLGMGHVGTQSLWTLNTATMCW